MQDSRLAKYVYMYDMKVKDMEIWADPERRGCRIFKGETHGILFTPWLKDDDDEFFVYVLNSHVDSHTS